MTEKIIFTSVDTARLLFAVAIVAIHTHISAALPGEAGFWLQQGIFRLAVPFFFITSGFFIMDRIEAGRDPAGVLTGYIKRLIVPFIICDAANALMNVIFICMAQDMPLRYAAATVVKKGIWYPYGAMWYIGALIIGALMLIPFVSKKGSAGSQARISFVAPLIIGGALFVWALICNNYFFIAEGTAAEGAVRAYMDTFVSARNGVFVGFFMLAVGLASRSALGRKIERNKGNAALIIALAACFALYLTEIAVLRDRAYLDDRSLYIIQIVLAPLMVIALVRLGKSVDTSAAAKDGAAGLAAARRAVYLRKMSVWIYFTHRFVLITLQIIMAAAGISAERISSDGAMVTLQFAVVTAVCVSGFIVFRLVKEKRPGAPDILEDRSLF